MLLSNSRAGSGEGLYDISDFRKWPLFSLNNSSPRVRRPCTGMPAPRLGFAGCFWHVGMRRSACFLLHLVLDWFKLRILTTPKQPLTCRACAKGAFCRPPPDAVRCTWFPLAQKLLQTVRGGAIDASEPTR